MALHGVLAAVRLSLLVAMTVAGEASSPTDRLASNTEEHRRGSCQEPRGGTL